MKTEVSWQQYNGVPSSESLHYLSDRSWVGTLVTHGSPSLGKNSPQYHWDSVWNTLPVLWQYKWSTAIKPHAGGKCPTVRCEMLTLQKQVSNKARALRREWLDVTLNKVNLAFTSGRLCEGWSQLKQLLAEPKRRAPVYMEFKTPVGQACDISPGGGWVSRQAPATTAQQPWTGLPVPSMGWVPCGWMNSDM